MNGYRKAISDNIPQKWDMALRWCECRTTWIEHVYSFCIMSLSKNKEKTDTVKILTGRMEDNLGVKHKFKDSIDWDNLSEEETEVWEGVVEWVNWFTSNGALIDDNIKSYSRRNLSFDDAATTLNYDMGLEDIKLAKFILTQSNYG